MPEGVQWGGQPIKLKTEFLVTQRIAPSPPDRARW
jgi:hypothetical protein